MTAQSTPSDSGESEFKLGKFFPYTHLVAQSAIGDAEDGRLDIMPRIRGRLVDCADTIESLHATVASLRTYCASRIESHERSLADPDPEDDSSPEWLSGFYTACKQMESLIDSKVNES